jgi:hypothetical protein
MFLKIVFTSYLEFKIMDKVHKPCDLKCYTPGKEYLVPVVKEAWWAPELV